MLNKLREGLSKTRSYFILNDQERAFVKFCKNKWGSKNKGGSDKSGGEILVDMLGFHPYVFRLSYIGNFFSSEYSYSIKTVHANCSLDRKSINKYLFRFSKLRRMFKSFGCDDGFKYNDINSCDLKRCESEAACKFDKINNKDDLVELDVEGIKIGDLIYDSYLRKYACATVDVEDERLLDLIKSALVVHRTSRNYLNTHDVRKVILSHAVYIEYGILARLAVAKGIDVYLFSKWNLQVVHKLTKSHYLQTNDHLQYKKKFILLDDKDARLDKARAILSHRLSGGIDAGTSYMKTSAYSSNVDMSNKIMKETGRPRIVIMLHCFYDSPHIYKDMLFADFFEWLDFTLNVLITTEFDIYVKPHPNGLPGNEAIVEHFKEKYQAVTFISKAVSNKQLITEGIDAVVTGYGTLGHEFPYMGVPVITAGDNPHSAYCFCNHAKSKEEYKLYLENSDKLPKDISKRDIEEFFYMHYLCPIDGRLDGDNDLFSVKRNRISRDQVTSSLLVDLIQDAEDGCFDQVDESFKLALSQVD